MHGPLNVKWERSRLFALRNFSTTQHETMLLPTFVISHQQLMIMQE